jgi:hypothetical protein
LVLLQNTLKRHYPGPNILPWRECRARPLVTSPQKSRHDFRLKPESQNLSRIFLTSCYQARSIAGYWRFAAPALRTNHDWRTRSFF